MTDTIISLSLHFANAAALSLRKIIIPPPPHLLLTPPLFSPSLRELASAVIFSLLPLSSDELLCQTKTKCFHGGRGGGDRALTAVLIPQIQTKRARRTPPLPLYQASDGIAHNYRYAASREKTGLSLPWANASPPPRSLPLKL